MSPSAELAAEDVDVWEVALDMPDAAVAEHAALLSADETARAGRFIAALARRQYIISRASIRMVLSTYLAQAPRDIVFTVVGDGKPALAEPNELHLEFNSTHSGGLALIAVSRARQVGIDVEHVRPVPKALQLAKRFFSSGEYRILSDLPDDDRGRAFLSIWVSREGTAKAQGLSVWRGLAGNAISAGWTVGPIDLGVDYVGVVVAEGDDWRVVRRGVFRR